MADPPAGVSSRDGQLLTIDALARVAQLPVRTIREYQTLRLLPPPERRGRVGLYGQSHRERLALIVRLQQRGYSLAGIRDLLTSFDAGANLPALLGVEIGPGALDETPLRLTRDQLSDRLPGLTATALRRAGAVGLVHREDGDTFLVRSPALLALVADGVAAGVPLAAMLDLVRSLRERLGELATTIAGHVVDDMWEPIARGDRTGDIEPFLQRGRLLLLQAVASLLADRLGDALNRRAATATAGEDLKAGIERVRVGVVIDDQGNLEQWRSE
jgi:DNA-binding transcriptional MerR regulator